MEGPTPISTSTSLLPASTPITPPPASSVPRPVCHKSVLHQYTQKSALPLPMYHTINLGLPHMPQFKSTVVVGGETFESDSKFLHLKEAEQDVARAALEGIAHNLKIRGLPIIKNDTTFCKSILFEYSAKMKLEKPVYTTDKTEGPFPLFITTVVFDGKTYVGEKGKNKKEAEQIAARVAVDAILGSSTGTLMSQIVNAKGRLYAALGKNNGPSPVQDTNAGLRGRVENPNTGSISNAKEMQSATTIDKSSSVAVEEYLSSGQPATASAVSLIPVGSAKPKEEVNELTGLGGTDTSLSTLQQSDPVAESAVRVALVPVGSEKPKEEINELYGLGGTDTSLSTLQQSDPVAQSAAANEFQGMTSNSGRKRKTNKKRSRSKKARTDEQPPVYAETVAQGVA